MLGPSPSWNFSDRRLDFGIQKLFDDEEHSFQKFFPMSDSYLKFFFAKSKFARRDVGGNFEFYVGDFSSKYFGVHICAPSDVHAWKTTGSRLRVTVRISSSFGRCDCKTFTSATFPFSYFLHTESLRVIWSPLFFFIGGCKTISYTKCQTLGAYFFTFSTCSTRMFQFASFPAHSENFLALFLKAPSSTHS